MDNRWLIYLFLVKTFWAFNDEVHLYQYATTRISSEGCVNSRIVLNAITDIRTTLSVASTYLSPGKELQGREDTCILLSSLLSCLSVNLPCCCLLICSKIPSRNTVSVSRLSANHNHLSRNPPDAAHQTESAGVSSPVD